MYHVPELRYWMPSDCQAQVVTRAEWVPSWAVVVLSQAAASGHGVQASRVLTPLSNEPFTTRSLGGLKGSEYSSARANRSRRPAADADWLMANTATASPRLSRANPNKKYFSALIALCITQLLFARVTVRAPGPPTGVAGQTLPLPTFQARRAGRQTGRHGQQRRLHGGVEREEIRCHRDVGIGRRGQQQVVQAGQDEIGERQPREKQAARRQRRGPPPE